MDESSSTELIICALIGGAIGYWLVYLWAKARNEQKERSLHAGASEQELEQAMNEAREKILKQSKDAAWLGSIAGALGSGGFLLFFLFR